tara:strand:+ start:564 stop:1313 length:750 start_codon:yes stop_codon:yes gene_type:complete
MFENVIKFRACKEYVENNKDIFPVPTKTNIPEWFKKLEHSATNQTIKGCIPFLETLTSGYLLKMPIDYLIEHNVDFKDKKQTGFMTGIYPDNNLSNKININYTDRPSSHPIKQLGGSPLVDKNKKLPFHKILNPWQIETPPGYSTLFVPPLNNSDDRFSIVPGIVDTDSFVNTHEINFPIVINGDKYETLCSTIKRGTPYVQLIPFKRDDWKMKIENTEDNKISVNKFFQVKHVVHNYKKVFWRKKSWK